MSYILDALRKSEKERQQGTVPDFMTVQDVTAQEPKKRSLLAYLLLIALLLNAVLLVWWLIPGSSKKSVVVSSSAEKQHVPKTSESPAPHLMKTPGAAITTNKDETETGPKTATKEAKPKTLAQQKKPVQPATVLKQQTDKPPLASNTKSLHEASSSAPQQTEIAKQVLPESRVINKSPLRIYNLDDLPLSVKQNLPPIAISVSLYSDDPNSRMAKINGSMIREGENLTADLKVDEITPDSVIFSYQSYRFKVGYK